MIAEKTGSVPMHEYSLFELLKRPELHYDDIQSLQEAPLQVAGEVAEQVEIDAKYAGYIARQQEEIARMQRQENTPIPTDFDFSAVKGLSNEVKQKLMATRPDTLSRASRIPGVTPAAISLLLIYLKRKSMVEKKIAS